MSSICGFWGSNKNIPILIDVREVIGRVKQKSSKNSLLISQFFKDIEQRLG